MIGSGHRGANNRRVDDGDGMKYIGIAVRAYDTGQLEMERENIELEHERILMENENRVADLDESKTEIDDRVADMRAQR